MTRLANDIIGYVVNNIGIYCTKCCDPERCQCAAIQEGDDDEVEACDDCGMPLCCKDMDSAVMHGCSRTMCPLFSFCKWA